MAAEVKIGAGAGARPWWIGTHEDRGQWNQLPANVTAEEMLRLAGISHIVGKSPVYTYPTTEHFRNKALVKVPGQYAMIRKEIDGSVNVMPGVIVGQDYTPIQVSDAFKFGDELLNASQDGEMVAHWHTAGELLDGTIFASAVIDKELYVAGDKIESYFMMVTKHDGKSSFRVKLTNVRPVCRNTVSMASQDGTPRDFSMRHTTNYRTRMEEARKILQLTTKAHAEFERLAQNLLAIPVPMKSLDFKGLMEHLFPVPENLKGVDQIDAQRIKFLRVLHQPDLANIKDTAWGMVNAAADYEQHHKQIRSQNEAKIVETLFKRSFGADSNTSLVTKAKEFVLAL